MHLGVVWLIKRSGSWANCEGWLCLLSREWVFKVKIGGGVCVIYAGFVDTGGILLDLGFGGGVLGLGAEFVSFEGES